MSNANVVRVATDQLEARDLRANTLAGYSQELQRIVWALQTDEGRRLRARIGKEPERGGRDDAERSFGPDEEALHIVAGVVLAQLAQGVDDAAVSEHGFDASHEVARIAVSDDV